MEPLPIPRDFAQAATVFVGIVVAMLVQDAAKRVAAMIAARMNPLLRPGQKLFVDGEEAVVNRVSLFATEFMIYRGEKLVIRNVSNARIGWLRIERPVPLRPGGADGDETPA